MHIYFKYWVNRHLIYNLFKSFLVFYEFFGQLLSIKLRYEYRKPRPPTLVNNVCPALQLVHGVLLSSAKRSNVRNLRKFAISICFASGTNSRSVVQLRRPLCLSLSLFLLGHTVNGCPELIAANVIPAAVARPPALPPARPVLRLRNTALHCVTRFYSRRQHRYSPFAGQCNA